jgi:hypothetical protein
MKVQEIKSKIQDLTSGKNADELTVEFVIGDKKFFIQDMKAGTDTMEINVSRKSYQPTSLNTFKNTLDHATMDLNVAIHDQDNNQSYQIENLFCGEVFVEITVQN